MENQTQNQKTTSKTPDFNYRKFIPTGVAAVDTLVAYVYWHRLRALPVKFIYVKPLPWEQLKWYFRDAVDAHESDEFEFVFDSVTVRRGTALQDKAFVAEMWGE